MAILASLQEIAFNIRQNKLRTFLTGFGVFWGIFMLILMLGAGQGMQNGVEQGFSSDAQNSVWIFSRKTSIPYLGLSTGREIHFTQADLIAIKKEVPGVLIVSAENALGSFNRADILVKSDTRSASYGVFGVAPDYFKIKSGQDQLSGRMLNEYDDSNVRKVATLGSTSAKTLFPDTNPVGQVIEINGISFTVVGVFSDPGENGRQSERVYIPMSLFQKTYGSGQNRVDLITYQPRPDANPYEVEEQVLTLLRKRHRVSADDRSAIRANNLLRNYERINRLFAAIDSLLWFVGIGTLTTGVVGISNIMMITVKERTGEIGVRKALGATPIRIVSALLFESVLITATAGYVGLVFGVGLLELTNFVLTASGMQLDSFKRPEVNFSIAISSVAILVIAGMAAGFAPSWRAARISPVEAMKES
ncbi:MAG: ABC transporter permease [Pseudomonadales bacterium]